MNEMQVYGTIKLLEMVIKQHLTGYVASSSHLVVEGTTTISFNIKKGDDLITLYIYIQEDGLYKIVLFENANWAKPKYALTDLGVMQVINFLNEMSM